MVALPFNKKKLTGTQDIRLEVPVPDFTPYACHYDPNTILTKNGELIQTIKITGFTYERVGGEKLDLRDMVRKGIKESINASKYAVWFHTVRRKTNLTPEGRYSEIFPKYVNDSWNYLHDWQNQYVNELYISIIHEGVSLKIANPKEYLRTLFYTAYKNYHENYLDRSWMELNETVERMLLLLRDYGAKRLATVETKDTVFSEPLKFFGKIMHLTEEQLLIPVMDASEYLATHHIAFGNNTLEIKGEQAKRFGAVLTVKEYHEMSTEVIDKLLQLPQEFIITQCLMFVPAKQATNDFKYQQYVLSVSGDEAFSKNIGLHDLMSSDRGEVTDYCEQQISICLFADTIERLEVLVDSGVRALNAMGVVAVREDICMEEIFWSQLPANFMFIRRKSYLNTAKVGGFASLNNFPAGQATGNLWGPAVTVFRTAMGTPYFFNFHTEDNGHTLIVGPHGSGKTVLMNFLVSQARKFNPRVFFFDQFQAARVFIRALGGDYLSIDPLTPSDQHRFNPMLLEDTSFNRQFLAKWLGYLLEKTGQELATVIKEKTEKIVDKSFAMPREQRRLSKVLAEFGDDVASEFKDWIGNGKYAHLFDNEQDMFPTVYTQAFGVSAVVKDKTTLGPVISYLFQRIQLLLDGTPTMVVLDEAWKLVNNLTFAPELEGWLDSLRTRNAMVIFATETIEEKSQRQITQTLIKKIATQIYLPNPNADEAYTDVLGLSKQEFDLLKSMSREERHFLMKHGNVAIVGKLDLYGLDDVMALLSGGEETVKQMNEIIDQVGVDPNGWVPVFCEKVRKTSEL